MFQWLPNELGHIIRAAETKQAPLLCVVVLFCVWHAGEEQAKVEVLSGRLADLGEDVDALLATVAVQGEDEGAEQDEAAELL